MDWVDKNQLGRRNLTDEERAVTVGRIYQRIRDQRAAVRANTEDPGSKTTGLALVRETETVDVSTGEIVRAISILMLLVRAVKDIDGFGYADGHVAFRRRRRGNLRYRPARFLNRTKPAGWLAPSLQHRVDTTMAWVVRLRRWAPVTSLSTMLHRFDTQALQNPEISGAEYQHCTLFGYEVREYLLEKWGRTCVYCDAEHTPLTIDHIHPKSTGGSDRVSNLTLACFPCNQRKSNQNMRAFLAHDPKRLARIEVLRRAPLKDAAAINSTRWVLLNRLKDTGLDVEVSTGARSKWNRKRFNIPKAHCLDAVCGCRVDTIQNWQQPVLSIKATGRGSYQRTRLTKYGFPRGYLMRSKSAFGFQTGDMVRAVVTTGKKVGTYLGCVAIRARGSLNIQSSTGLVQGIHHRFCTLVQRADGYGYSFTKIGTGAACAAALSLPGLNAGVPRAN